MLIVKNLKKTYKAKGKGGQEVKALDDVSVTFPETGLIFLLGKSGSGKSTLLNVIGGLDKADSGEIIIKGRNSKTFSGADFDSYRNTFIGFIFQEYNILNEFNIEQNVALALQLQGKPNDRKAVQDILEKVDLNDPAILKRKPNTLSGGQKQRIAIARALIKNPEIIMADEPTGALDSNTGKQVFDTLKKLSQEKLVIVVSHDRDFAEQYGDRIIELKDGKIISDVSKEYVEPKSLNENISIVNDHTVAIKDTSKLTEADVKSLLTTLKSQNGEAVISSGEHDVSLVKQAIKINDNNSTEIFNNTKSVTVKEYNEKDTKFIRSRLPAARAIKMGSSSIGQKPFRLILTSLLTVIALTMFGLTSTLLLFRESYSFSKALQASGLNAEVLSKKALYTETTYQYNIKNNTKKKLYSYTDPRGRGAYFGVEELKQLNKNNVGHKYAGIFTFRSEDFNFSDSKEIAYPANEELNVSNLDNYHLFYKMYGFTDAGASYIENNPSINLEGTYPTSPDEIAISKYHFECFNQSDPNVYRDVNDIIGKEINYQINGNMSSIGVTLKVTGVFDAGNISSKFDKLKAGQTNKLTDQQLEKLQSDFRTYMESSFNLYAFVSDDFYDNYVNSLFSEIETTSYQSPRVEIYGLKTSNQEISPSEHITDEAQYESYMTDEQLGEFSNLKLIDTNGNAMEFTPLGENEAYLPMGYYNESVHKAYNRYYRVLSQFCDNLTSNLDNCKHYAPISLDDCTDEDAENLRNVVDYYAYNYSAEELKEGIEVTKPIRDVYLEYTRNITLENVFRDINYMINDMYDGDSSLASEKEKQAIDACNYLNSSTADYTNVDQYFDLCLELQPYALAYQANNHGSEMDIEDNNIKAIYLKAIDDYNNKTITVTQAEANEVYDYFENSTSSSSYYGFYRFTKNPQMPQINLKALSKIYYADYKGGRGTLTIKGFYRIPNSDGNAVCCSKNFLKEHGNIKEATSYTVVSSKYKAPSDGKYNRVITKTNFTQQQIENMMMKGTGYKYVMTDAISSRLSMSISIVSTLKQVFTIVGTITAVFAALMLLNFISTSIANKTKEIGILRAVGARGSDLFKIFFAESGIIAGICAILSIIASIIVSWRINVSLSQSMLGIQLLDFGFLNILIIFVGAIIIAILGTIVPVAIAAKKPPVESIRSL